MLSPNRLDGFFIFDLKLQLTALFVDSIIKHAINVVRHHVVDRSSSRGSRLVSRGEAGKPGNRNWIPMADSMRVISGRCRGNSLSKDGAPFLEP